MKNKLFADSSAVLLVGPCSIANPQLLNSYMGDMPILAVDGGVMHLDGHEYTSIGDGDSSNRKMDISFAPEKSQSDLQLALESLSPEIQSIHAFGFLGQRRDHEWINLGEFSRHTLRTHSQILLEGRTLFLPKGIYEIELEGVFSLMSLYENHISLDGQCEYASGESFELSPLSSKGLSNIAHGRVKIEARSSVIVHSEEQDLALAKCFS